MDSSDLCLELTNTKDVPDHPSQIPTRVPRDRPATPGDTRPAGVVASDESGSDVPPTKLCRTEAAGREPEADS